MKRFKYIFALAVFVGGLLSSLSAQDQETVWSSTDESFLIQVIQKEGSAPEDILIKNIACKRLAVIGTDAAIPALTAMLSNEDLNFNARFALEAMPGASVDDALINALDGLEGMPLVGVIDSIGVRGIPTAVEPLAALLEKTSDPAVKKAILIAFGYIATEDSINRLLAEAKKDADPELKVNAALADALMNAAETCVLAGDNAKAIEIYDVVANGDFPAFSKDGAAYNGLLARGADAAGAVATKLASEGNDFEVALKSIREFADTDAEPVVKAVLDVFPKLDEERQALVVRALGDRKDEVTKNLVVPFIADLVKNGKGAVRVAAIQAAGKTADLDPLAIYDALVAIDNAENADVIGEEWIMALEALPVEGIDEKLAAFSAADYGDVKSLSDQDKKRLSAKIKVLELRRIIPTGPALLEIANAEGVPSEIRDQAVAALSEIVPLTDLGLLVKALENETNNEKVDWNLRAACTRLPREDCAAEVVKMLDATDDLDGKAKLMNLLKQIGGPTALNAVVEACNEPETADKATEILGQWNSPDDAPQLAAACLQLAKESKSNKFKSRGIRGYIRIARQFDIPADQKILMAKTAFETATRQEDRILIFEIFKRIVDQSSVDAALSYAGIDGYEDAACDAAVFVAEKIQGTTPELQESMKKVIEITKSDDLKARAQKVLDRK